MAAELFVNYVGALQEYCTWRKYPMPRYEVYAEGADHARVFTTQCKVANITEIASAYTKVESKRLVAKYMLLELKKINKEIKDDETDLPADSMHHYSTNGITTLNYVGALQEYCVREHHDLPIYEQFIGRTSDGSSVYVVKCTVSNIEEKRTGSANISAKHNAARAVLAILQGTNVENEDIKYDPSKVPDIEEPGIKKEAATPHIIGDDLTFDEPLFCLKEYCSGRKLYPVYTLIQKASLANPTFIFKLHVNSRSAEGSGETELEAKTNCASIMLKFLIHRGEITLTELRALKKKRPSRTPQHVTVARPTYVLRKYSRKHGCELSFKLLEKPSELNPLFTFKVLIGANSATASGLTAKAAKHNCSQELITILIELQYLTEEEITDFQATAENTRSTWATSSSHDRQATNNEDDSPKFLLKQYCLPHYEIIPNANPQNQLVTCKVTVGGFTAQRSGLRPETARRKCAQAMLDYLKRLSITNKGP